MDTESGLSARPALTRRLKEECARLGFDAVGITTVTESEHATFFRDWLAAGYQGEMGWLARPDAVIRRRDPRTIWPELRSAIVVAHHYPPDRPDGTDHDPSKAVIARYARGRDYHRVMRPRLRALLRWLERETGRRLPAARACVDTSPVFERELARRAGLGWFGRNTMLIHPRRGSYFFLGVLLVEVELESDQPFEADHCGTCHACESACPTGALLGRSAAGAPVIDARRCISYLTIEHRGIIPKALRAPMGNRVFGCDICQEVCPFVVRFATPASEPAYAARPARPLPRAPQHGHTTGVPPRLHDAGEGGAEPWIPGTDSPALLELIRMTRAEWEAFSRGSAIRRAGYAGFLRNVVVALGNWGAPAAVPALATALAHDESLVRAHAAWALGQIGGDQAERALRATHDVDPHVRAEVRAALRGLADATRRHRTRG